MRNQPLTNIPKDCYCRFIGYYSSWDDQHHSIVHKEIKEVGVIGTALSENTTIWLKVVNSGGKFSLYDINDNKTFDAFVNGSIILFTSSVSSVEYQFDIDSRAVSVVKVKIL